MIFKQRLFSWFDSYDIYSEDGGVYYRVEGKLGWGHKMHIYDGSGNFLGMIKEKVITWLPEFEMYSGDTMIGTLSKEFTFLRPKYNIDFNGWHIEGDFLEWDYRIVDSRGYTVAVVSKDIWHWTDTYVIDVEDPQNAFFALMVVLSIDAEKCSRSS